MAQAIRSSRLTAGVPSSRLGNSIWVSWWTKRKQGRIFLGFSTVFPHHKFRFTISPQSSHSFSFISFIRHMMVRQAWSPDILAIHRLSIKGLHRISSLDLVLHQARVEDIFIYLFVLQSRLLLTESEQSSLPRND